MATVTIDSSGRWLDRTAGEAYKRARKGGLPAGINSAGRTTAQQRILWDAYRAGRGPLASKPGTSWHEKGLAIDLPAPARDWMSKHGKAYGFRRINNGENWHFQYYRQDDLHRPALHKGSKGWEVKELQHRLGIKPDGIYGSQTEASVRAFQKRHGLSVDGIAGINTRSALGM